MFRVAFFPIDSAEAPALILSAWTVSYCRLLASVCLQAYLFSPLLLPITITVIFFVVVVFLGHTHGIWRFLGYGSNWSHSCQPTPQLQQGGIRAYTTGHGNARSSTHWGRPGIEPTTSWFLVRFVSAVPQQELLQWSFRHENPVKVSYYQWGKVPTI